MSIQREGIRIFPPRQILQRLPIVLAHVKLDYTAQNLLNEIKKTSI